MGFQLSEQFTQVRYLVLSALALNINTRVHLFSRRTGCAGACGEQLPDSPALQPCGPQAGSSGVPGAAAPTPGLQAARAPRVTRVQGVTALHSQILGRFCTWMIKLSSGTPALKKGPGRRASSVCARSPSRVFRKATCSSPRQGRVSLERDRFGGLFLVQSGRPTTRPVGVWSPRQRCVHRGRNSDAISRTDAAESPPGRCDRHT